MSRILKLSIILTLCIPFTFMNFSKVEASLEKYRQESKGLEEELGKVNKEIEDLGMDAGNLSFDLRKAELDLEGVHDRFRLVEEKRDASVKELIEVNENLSKYRNEIKVLEKEELFAREKFGSRVEVISEGRSIEFLKVFLGSVSIGDFLMKMGNYSKVLENDKNELEEYERSIDELSKGREKLEQVLARLEILIDKLEVYDKELAILHKESILVIEILELEREKIADSLIDLGDKKVEVEKELNRLRDKEKELVALFSRSEGLSEKLGSNLEIKKDGVVVEGLGGEIDLIIKEVANRYNLPVELIKAVIQTESGFRVDAVNVNRNGTIDRGLMQINSNTAPGLASILGFDYEVGIEFVPEVAIEMGAYYLDRNRSDKGLDYMLTSYNRGPSGVKKWFRENGTYESPYSKKVKEYMQNF